MDEAGAGDAVFNPGLAISKQFHSSQTSSALPLSLGTESGDRICFYVLIIYSAQAKVVYKLPNDSG